MKIDKDFYDLERRPYYIYAPGYRRTSVGVRALHLLCHYLNKMGEEAYVLTTEIDITLRTPVLTKQIINRHKAANRSPIGIYPEITHGNPLRTSSVVRYILNHPGLLGGPKQYNKTDMLLYWADEYVDFSKTPNPHYLHIPTIDTSLFNNLNNTHDSNRQSILVYPGRYEEAEQNHPELFNGTTIITADWPQSHEELAALFRKGKVLYCFANSSILSEALLCGCPVVFKDSPYTRRPDNMEGENLTLLMPGITTEDTPQAIERARRQLKWFDLIYNQHLIELPSQLKSFITASQQLPKIGPELFDSIIFDPPSEDHDPEQTSYQKWLRQRRASPSGNATHASLPNSGDNDQAKFILLMPLRLEQLQESMKTIASLIRQSHGKWQLILIADFDAPSAVFTSSESIGWLRIDDANDSKKLTEAYSAILNALPSDWVSIIPPGTELEEYALATLQNHARRNPEWLAIYSDHDFLDAKGKRCRPAFKPDFNLDYLRCTDYISHAICFKSTALQATEAYSNSPGADNYDAILRIHDRFGGAAIGHISEPLVHLPSAKPDIKTSHAARAQALSAHLSRNRIDAEIAQGMQEDTFHIRYPLTEQALVSIIIADDDSLLYLSSCLAALGAATDYSRYEILVVAQDAVELPPGARLIEADAEKSLIQRYQEGARQAQGDYLLFLDSRLEAVQPDWLRRLLSLAARPDTGAVSPRLLTADASRIWRGPYLLGADGCAASLMAGQAIDAAGHLNRQHVEHDVSAVALDCLLIAKSLYQELGGLNAALNTQASAGIDLCLKVRATGKLIAWTPFASLLHHATTAETIDLSDAEQATLRRLWRNALDQDPAYNIQLSLDSSSAFRMEELFTTNWHANLEPLPRVLALENAQDGRDRFLQAMTQMTHQGSCLSAVVRSGKRLPTISEIERLAPDVIIQPLRLDAAFLAWHAQYRQYRSKSRSIFMADARLMSDTLSQYDAKLLQNLAQQADRIIVPTAPLQDWLSRFAADVRVVPDTLDDECWGERIAIRRIGVKMRVGWVADAQDEQDLLLMQNVVAKTIGEIDWIAFGYCPDLMRPYLAEHHPGDIADEAYPDKLANLGLDLAILPKAIHAGNEAASLLRLLEFGALGIPVVCTDILPFQTAPACVARLSNDATEWMQTLQEKLADRNACHRSGEELRNWVKQHHMLSQNLHYWREALAF
ncbi:glycosyltransferase [Chromobacterium amazonense]|uniref:glycosyltransferase n=1 Tax=Chromobacterium amazonense TaxID=1382803 RepID=UPI0031F69BA9